MNCSVHSGIEAITYCTTDGVLYCAKCCSLHKTHKTITLDEFKKTPHIQEIPHVKQEAKKDSEKKQEVDMKGGMQTLAKQNIVCGDMKNLKIENKEEAKKEKDAPFLIQPSIPKEQAIEKLHKLYQPTPNSGRTLRQKIYSKNAW